MFLTDDIIRALPLPVKSNKVYFDTMNPDVPDTKAVVTVGLGLRITAGGHRAWVFRYRLRDGSGDQRKLTIGRYPHISIANARVRARKLREEIEGGADPQGAKAARRAAPTISKLAEEYDAAQMAQVRADELRMSTLVGYRRLIRLYIVPELGRIKVTDLDQDDVKRLHRKITADDKRVQANRVVALLSVMLNYAIGEGLRTDNPCNKAVRPNKERARVRYLQPDECGRVVVELARHTNPAARTLQFIMVTGCRKSEAMQARWPDFALDGAVPEWNRKWTDQKPGEDHTMVLNNVAVQLLNTIHAETIAEHGKIGEFVFVGSGRRGHVVELRKTWVKVVRDAKIENFRVHDLRHHYASVLASSGVSMVLIGKLLGHRSPSSTHRYVHLFKNPQLEATNRAGAIIAATAGVPEPAADAPEPAVSNVIPMHGKQ
jgi:integrase